MIGPDDPARIVIILQRQRTADLRLRIELSVLAKSDSDCSEMIMGRAIFVHVARSAESMQGHGAKEAVFRTEFLVRIVCIAAVSTREPLIAVNAENGFAEPGLDGRRRKLNHQARCR